MNEDQQQNNFKTLEKSINRLLNQVSRENIKEIVVEFFKLNILRGKGLFVRKLILNQLSSNNYTPIFSSLVAVINSKIPEIGELLATRLVLQFRKYYKNRDVENCKKTSEFISQLANQFVVYEVLLLQILHLLLEKTDEDNLSIVVDTLRQSAVLLQQASPKLLNVIFDKLRFVLQEGLISRKLQMKVEELFALRRNDFRDLNRVEDDLDLVEEDEQITHMIDLDDLDLDEQVELNQFKYDPIWEQNEEIYNEIRKEILGDEDDEESEEESESEKEEEENKVEIKDMTNTDETNFQKTVYLTIMSSMNSEEAVHKLLKLNLVNKNKDEILIDMIIRCCSQEKTYTKYYGKIGERLASLNYRWDQVFGEQFEKYYTTCDNFETNQLRNIAKFWGHLFASDKLKWEHLSIIEISEDKTTPSSRIFIKFMFQELVEELTVSVLQERLMEPYMKKYLKGMFPEEDEEHLRFLINFFTAIGLGVLTEEMRSLLLEQEERGRSEARGRARSQSRSYSRSRSEVRGRQRSRTRSPNRDGSRSRSYSRSRSRSYSRSRSRSYSRSRSSSR